MANNKSNKVKYNLKNVQRSPRFFHQNQVWRMRKLVRLKGVALQQQVPQDHLAVQSQI